MKKAIFMYTAVYLKLELLLEIDMLIAGLKLLTINANTGININSVSHALET